MIITGGEERRGKEKRGRGDEGSSPMLFPSKMSKRLKTGEQGEKGRRGKRRERRGAYLRALVQRLWEYTS